MAPTNRALLLALLCLYPSLALSQSGFNPYPGYSCPPAFAPISTFRGDTYHACTEDVCYNDAVGCGPGNTCSEKSSSSPFGNFYERSCQCKPPYVQGLVQGYYTYRTSCYIPGNDVCNPNPCQNGGTCFPQRETLSAPPWDDPNGTIVDFGCSCPQEFAGRTCSLPLVNGQFPEVIATAQGYSGPLAAVGFGDSRLCDDDTFFRACLYADGKHYVCCDGLCGPIGPDGMTPLCVGSGIVPSPNDYPIAPSPPNPGPTPAPIPFPPPVANPQGLCGLGYASPYPIRCYFNNDPQGRYVCCDLEGCDGFNPPDNLEPHCKASGGLIVTPDSGNPPNPPQTSPPSEPPSGSQGVCGSGAASPFPTRCYFNNDPQGRYVCCDSAGCNGFNPPDNLIPHCKANGYAPPGYGVGSPSTPPATAPPSVPPSGSQGICGSGAAGAFPTRCYFNSDPQGRYVCCDAAGCDGFNPPDNLFPHCKANGYVPPGYGVGSPETSPPPNSGPPSGSQGVCGTGGAAAFPVRCYYNNDSQGRYVCCDSAGCDGFNPPDNFFPHCKANGYVPPSL
ncbi:hypothetical protein KFL_000420110 [Klebsormidium nitens]|uniref:EGF-like domain-containing protein n=1 Tax=Klebsormidium nitens TaxID=105231 RepID=A0A1Y1HRZ0_KLENI|nr:hypothetical protein KFL_000420110 [Klebsormidium nitens]|eukprot:GAQ79939.1 hypothetical protein KFL_000420110 [Klebsormidium nitens]